MLARRAWTANVVSRIPSIVRGRPHSICTSRNTFVFSRSSSTVTDTLQDKLDAATPLGLQQTKQEKKYPPTNRLYVGNLRNSITQEELVHEFSIFGEIAQVDIPYIWNGTGHGYAFVTFSNQDDAIAAHESFVEEPISLGGLPLFVRYAAPRDVPTYINPPSRKVFFRNFPGDEVDLRQLLEPWKRYLERIKFLRDRKTDRLTGSGLILFTNVNRAFSALRALQESGEAKKYSMEFARYIVKVREGTSGPRESSSP